MFDIGILLMCFWWATITTLLFLLLEMVPSSRIKIFILPVGGVILFFFSVILNFQPSDGLLYPIKLIVSPLFWPCLILSPLPLFRKKQEAGIGKFSIFFGAFFILIIFLIFPQLGINLTGQVFNYTILMIGFAAEIVAFSAMVFYGISLISPFLFRTNKEDRNSVDPELKKKTYPFGKIIIIAGCLLFLCSPFFLIDYIGGFESCGGFEVHKMPSSSTIHEGNIIHLTENDFREFPKLGNIVKAAGNLQETCSGFMSNSQNCIGGGSYSCNQESLLYKYYQHELEYEGQFYIIQKTYIV
jgi:hypothetical protein